jgi:cathepsin B
MSIVKSFGTILKDNKYVRFQSSKYSTVKARKKVIKDIPVEFNPIDKWGVFLSPIHNQGQCGACWAIASTKTLNDRYGILTVGALTDTFSPYQMIMCQGTIFPTIPLDKKSIYEINLDAHTSGACNGNSLFTAMDFLYSVGCVSETCVSRGLFKEYNIPDISDIVNAESVPMCQTILGDNYDRCMDRSRTPCFYRSIVGYQVDSDVEAIKQEIYKWGPVVSGFKVYDDFINDYDGKTIYMGPKNGSNNIGGHSIEILGWGRENGVDYWWCCNSWGTEWGLSGFFKMKMSIKECELETNVIGFIPDFPGFSMNMIDYPVTITPELKALRIWMNIDPTYGYKNTVIQDIKDGKIKGDLEPIFVRKIPDMFKEWFGDIDKHNAILYYSVPHFSGGKTGYNFQYFNLFLIIVFIILCYYGGKYSGKYIYK